MALTYSTKSELGSIAPAFNLPGTDGKQYGLDSFKSSKALLIVFMCNHCPYVIATQKRINQLAREFGPRGLQVVGINSNDSVRYPDDSFEAMKKRVKEEHFVFPYLWDESQEVAKVYDAVCTPDPYLYERVGSDFVLRYRGRIDDSWKDESQVKKRELASAIEAVLSSQPVNPDQMPSMGCSIKWRN